MRLIDLEAYFVTYRDRIEPREFAIGDHLTWKQRGYPTERRVVTVHYRHHVDSLAVAQGVEFLCPKCFVALTDRLGKPRIPGPIGTHWCEVTFEGRGVKPEQGVHNKEGKPVRWNVSGTGLADLTTTPSILLQGGCNWHGYITNGLVS